jgi:hypothetical protein
MKRSIPAVSPDAYVAALTGWQRKCVEALRAAVRAAAPLEEAIKWRNVVYFENGPVVMIRAEESRVLLGFWRGQRLRDIEPRLRPGGKYEMATIELREGMSLPKSIVRRLVTEAVRLNQSLGDPTDVAGVT